MKNFQACCACVTLLSTLLLLSGCSKPGGGADSVVHVQPKSSNLSIFKEVAAPVDTNDGGTAPKPSGKPGTFSGRVVVTGAVAGKPSLTAKDAVCSLFKIPNESLLVGEGGGLANVFVYLDKAPKNSKFDKTPPANPVAFVNKGCRFQPHALIVRTGQKVQVTNEDAVGHNAHTMPKRNEEFNQLVQPKDTSGDTFFFYEKPEVQPVAVKCDIHGWMKAYQLPLNHPYVALTDEDGNFEIKNLPPGKHTFKIWHEANIKNKGFINSRYKITIDGDQTITIKVPSENLADSNNIPSKTLYLSQLK